MARVLILTDRAPNESECKGAVVWQTILALAETQHEVLVVTPLPLEEITVTHPRLTVLRPVTSWLADQVTKLVRVILTFQPQVIHSFAFKKQTLPAFLTVWPYVLPLVSVFPLKRVSTFFEEADIFERDAAASWHKNSDRFAVFGQPHDVASRLPEAAEIIPLPLELMSIRPLEGGEEALLIPAPVDTWPDAELGLQRAKTFLTTHPDLNLRILGGWGEYPLSKRKEAWKKLGPFAARIELREAASFTDFVREIADSQGLWCEPLAPRSWRARLAMRIARQMNKAVRGLDLDGFELAEGSIANALSRLYSQQNGRANPN